MNFEPGSTFTRSKERSIRPIDERFWEAVDKSGDCWLRTTAPTKNGYSQISIRGKKLYAHRLSYEIENGPIPEGMVIDHTCHNKGCVKPEHLRPATTKQNMENRAGVQVNCKSGVRGVSWHKRAGKWTAQVRHNKRTYYAGLYDDIGEAEAAVIAKRLELFTHNNLDRNAA